MRYTYAYKTSDGVRHEAAMDAESRDVVFATLRTKGIKAIKVVAADGSKANGEERGIAATGMSRPLWGRLFAATVVVLAGIAVFLVMRTQESDVERDFPENAARPLPRQEILGDRKRIEQLPDDVRSSPVDAFLARFAEPGRPFEAPEAEWPNRAAFEAAFGHPLMVSEREFTEHVDLKRMIEGMKREMRLYLRLGGLVSGYIRELIRRQTTEIAYREKAERRLEELLAQPSGRQAAYDYWVRANAQLQSMGIYALPLPPSLKGMRPDVDLGE